MPSAAEPAQFGAPPRYGHNIIPINRLGLTGHITLTKISIGFATLAGASGSIDSLTIGGMNIMSASVPFNTSADVTSNDVIANINANGANHNYWAFKTATSAKLAVAPKNPWAADTSALVTTGSTMTSTDVNLNTGQSFVAAARVPSGASNITGTSVYAVGIDMSNMPANTQTIMGTGSIGGHPAMKMNAQSIVGYGLNFTSDQNVTINQGYEGADLFVADATFVRRRDLNLFQWREIPTFLTFAAAASFYYELRSF
jgi:hypothetical protein